MSSIRISLGFDMRSPDWATPTAELYAAAIEMAAYADGLGIDGVIIGCAGGQTLPPATTIGFVITEPGTYPVSLDVAGTELGTVVVS